MKRLMQMIALFISIAGVCSAEDVRNQYRNIIAQEKLEPAAAFEAMTLLAESGYAPALHRTGFYFRHGVGTDKDLELARLWYARAVSAGHPWSIAALARVEMLLGRGDAAYELLQAAVVANAPGVQRLFASAHVDRKLGFASDPALGRRMLEDLAATGSRNAARDLVVRVNWGRLREPVSDVAVALTVQSGLEGDARFAEVALTYLSLHGAKDATTIRTRSLLANTPGMRDRFVSVERIRMAADQRPGTFWAEVEQVLAGTQAENYARAASTAFRINKNAWVRVLQIELKALGYYAGRINGLMTSRTIAAQNQFCKESGIWSVCALGPLRGSTVRTVANAIALLGEET